MQLRKHRLATSLALAATLPSTALAQEAVTTLPEVKVTGSQEQPTFIEDRIGSGRLADTPLRDVPQSLTVINEQVMESQGTKTLTEALRNVPGITIGAGEGGYIGDNINLRGFSARTDLFLDGFRDRGQYTRDTFFIESVEVLKGPSSMLFGRGSTGGVINQNSKTPRDEAIREIDLSIGTESLYRLTADLNQPMSESSAFRVAVMGQTNESTRDVVEAETYGIAPSLSFGLGTPTQLTLSALYQHRDEIPDYGFPVVQGTRQDPGGPLEGVDRDNFYGFSDDEFEQDVGVLTARLQHRFSDSLTLRNQLQYSDVSIHAMPSTISTISASTGERRRRERDIDDKSLYNQTDLVARFATGSIRHTLLAGVELGRDDYRRRNYDWTEVVGNEFDQDLDDPVYGDMPDTALRTRGSLQEADGTTIAVYLNDTIELNQHWKLVGGLRWDRFKLEQDTTEVGGAVTELERTDHMTSVRAGVIYQPTDTQSYYVSYGTSFNPSTETVTLSAANESVGPEKNRSIEVGGKWDLMDGNLALNAAVFQVDKTDARTQDEFGDTVLGGEIRVRGVELGVAGNITPDWMVLAGYTFLDGEIRKLTDRNGSHDGNTLPNAPEHTATLWTTYRLHPHWEVGGGAFYSSKRVLNNANTAETDGYTRVDATVAYLQQDYDIRLNLYNITDEEYFEAATGGRAVPAQGPSAMLTLNYRM